MRLVKVNYQRRAMRFLYHYGSIDSFYFFFFFLPLLDKTCGGVSSSRTRITMKSSISNSFIDSIDETMRELSYACSAQQQRTRQTISVRPTWDILNDRFCSFLPGCKKGMEIRSTTSTYNIFDIESDRCPWWSSLRLIRGSRIESELNSKRGSTFCEIFRQIQKITFTRNFATFLDFKLPLSPIIRLTLLIVEFSTSTEVLDVHVSSYIG